MGYWTFEVGWSVEGHAGELVGEGFADCAGCAG